MDFDTGLKLKKIFKPIVIAICCVSFIATSLARHYQDLHIKSEFSFYVNYDFDTVKQKLLLDGDTIFAKGNYYIDVPEKKSLIVTLTKFPYFSRMDENISE